jgi:hypothetical protein
MRDETKCLHTGYHIEKRIDIKEGKSFPSMEIRSLLHQAAEC